MDDRSFLTLMTNLCGADDDQAMWDAIAADITSGVLDASTLCDPVPTWTEGERAASGDLLAAESLWLATAEAEDRQGRWWDPSASGDPGKHEDWDEWLDDWHKEDE